MSKFFHKRYLSHHLQSPVKSSYCIVVFPFLSSASSILAFTLLISLVSFHTFNAEAKAPKGDPIVMRVVELDYADADHLAGVLAPLLSPEGRILANSRTNSLIIKDRASIVKSLVEIIKGPGDHGEY